MAARFFLFVLLLVAHYSLGAATALAARHPGAPRPLRAQAAGEATAPGSALLQGVAPVAVGDQLRFTGDDALAREQIAVRVSRDDNKSAWSLTSRSLFAEALPDPRTISPDGRRRVFAATRAGVEAIYVAEVDAPASSARRVATSARNPAWLDASTLLFESTLPGHTGIYQVAVPGAASSPAPRLWFEKAGEVAVSPDGQSVCVAARGARDRGTQLYLLAPDGSGARAISGTSGARRPCFSASGDEIYFDAPAPRTESGAGTARAPRVIWMLPLVSTPPAAQLTEVRPTADGAAEIYGTAFSEAGGALQVRLEVARTDDATDDSALAWKKIETRPAPIHGGVLALWQPAGHDQNASFQLRLTVTDADGDHAQSSLNFNWPPVSLAADKAVAPPLFATRPELYGLEEAPPTAAARPVPAPPAAPPLPLPAAPARALTPSIPTPRITGAPRLAPAPQAAPATPAPVANAQPQKPQPVKAHAARQAPRRQQTEPNSGGIPAQMKANSTVPVTVVLRNTGSRSWSSTGESPVRLIYRWVDARTNIRHYWAVKWLRETVQPGDSTRLKFDLKAPTRAGDFVLTYALVRLGPQNYDGKKYLPPPAKSADQRWPGEFGAVSFHVKVTP